MFHRFSMLAAFVLVLSAQRGLAQGKLTQELKVTQFQGGVAGFTGVRITISPDGTWKSEDIANQKATPRANGRLSDENLAKLGKLLDKVQVTKLPAKTGTAPAANPFSLTIELGKTRATWVGRTPPDVRPDNPNDSVDTRFGAIWEAVRVMAMPPNQ